MPATRPDSSARAVGSTSQIVIPTEGPLGLSGGIWGVDIDGSIKQPFPQIGSLAASPSATPAQVARAVGLTTQIVIPTEGPLGPSGGIWGVDIDGSIKQPFPQIGSLAASPSAAPAQVARAG